MTSSTTSPTAQDTVFPPKVLKNSMPLSKEAAISGVVTTAPSGWPLPIGLRPSRAVKRTPAFELELLTLRRWPTTSATIHAGGTGLARALGLTATAAGSLPLGADSLFCLGFHAPRIPPEVNETRSKEGEIAVESENPAYPPLHNFAGV